jgi:heat shock protein HtpX
VILDSDASPAKIAALGATLALGATYWLLRSAATAPPRPLSMTRHHPSDPRTALLQHRWLNRLQTGLLVLTLVGIAAAAGRLPFGEGCLWLALFARCVAAGTGSRVGAELAPVPRTGLAPARSPQDVGPVARAARPCRFARHAGAALCAQCRRQRLRHRIEAGGIDRPHRWPAAQPEPTRAGGCARARGRAHR